MSIGLKHIIKLFEKGNVCVCGMRGDGKDVLMGNVVVRRKLPYVANINYTDDYIPYDPKEFDCGHNDYRNFISGDINYYVFPYEDGTDIYVSDVGVYFPSQFCNELDRQYKYVPTFMALSRQLGECNFHLNVQALCRCWTKIREQSDTYVSCTECHYIKKGIFKDYVIQKVIIYDKYESCLSRVEPFRVTLPLFASREMRLAWETEKERYRQSYGLVEGRWLIYKNKSTYDTREFRNKLANGKKK